MLRNRFGCLNTEKVAKTTWNLDGIDLYRYLPPSTNTASVAIALDGMLKSLWPFPSRVHPLHWRVQIPHCSSRLQGHGLSSFLRSPQKPGLFFLLLLFTGAATVGFEVLDEGGYVVV